MLNAMQGALFAAQWVARFQGSPATLLGDCNLVLHDDHVPREHVEALMSKILLCSTLHSENECILISGPEHLAEEVLELLLDRMRCSPLAQSMKILNSMTCLTLDNGKKKRVLEGGLVLQCHLDTMGECIGAELMVSNVAAGALTRHFSARNLDIFYLLLSSMGPSESAYLGLTEQDLACSMLKADMSTIPIEKALGQDFRAALKECGIQFDISKQLHSLLAACVHLSNITFLQNSKEVQIAESDSADEVCALLNIDIRNLAAFLFPSPFEMRDWLIAALYNSALHLVVLQLNHHLAHHQAGRSTSSSISIIYTPPVEADELSLIRSLAVENLAKSLLFENIFADVGVNAERTDDGLDLPHVDWSKETAVIADLLTELEMYGKALGAMQTGRLNGDNLSVSGRSVSLSNLEAQHELDARCSLSWPILQNNLLLPQPKMDLRKLIESSRLWSVLIIDPAQPIPTQVSRYQLSEMSQRLIGPSAGCIDLPLKGFADAYGYFEAPGIYWGRTKVWLTFDAWASLPSVGSVASKSVYSGYDASRDDWRTKEQEDSELQEIQNEVNPATKHVQTKKLTPSRRTWLVIVGCFTWWIPDFVLKFVGRMQRPDVRQAWREKVTLFTLIMLLCGCVVFYIIFLGKLVCPDMDKAWSAKEVQSHTGEDDFYVSLHGKVYDISNFWRIQHSDNAISTTQDMMEPFAGLDLSDYFPSPLLQACPGLVRDDTWLLLNTSVDNPLALHYSTIPECLSIGSLASRLCLPNWFFDRLLPTMKKFQKGDLVVTRNKVRAAAQNGERHWAIIDGNVYDLTNYFYTSTTLNPTRAAVKPDYYFFDSFVEGLFQGRAGRDVTKQFNDLANWNASRRAANLRCLQNAFYYGKVDFRQSPRCQANNYIMLSFTIMLCTVIVVKFLASLQFGGSRPARQNRLVICQYAYPADFATADSRIPVYTEGEDQLRNAIDSVTDLDYPDELKLLFIVCDGVLVGQGNKIPTCEIVLDILGADQSKIAPPILAYESVAEGSKVYNRAKIYAGLYEHDGHVVPYLVLVKVGNEKETHRAGNRGKRDSQIMLIRFLNRFHTDKPMSPFEIEMAYQMSQVIGISPGMYEYVLMLDADTKLAPDSLNILVSAFQADAKLMGTCGETALAKQELSWWTMIQVYEYYNSHALSKAFESLFGNVTCLPGCFCIYRVKSASGAPLLISNEVVDGYSDTDISTLRTHLNMAGQTNIRQKESAYAWRRSLSDNAHDKA
jgi:cytochrome b involved in lipid metabolism